MKKVSSVRRCRLCACEDILNNFYNIFDDKSELKLEMKIRKLLPVVVMSWDPMPHVICHNCTVKLNTFNEFYETSLKTERFLRTLHLETPAKRKATPRLPENEKGPQTPDGAPDKSSDLVITPVGCREYVYTCRRCCRTFTEESSATVHPCAAMEDCRELETEKKCLPPLKIRLFAVRSGLFVCCLCNKQFEDKKELEKHIKEHFLEERWEKETKTRMKCNKEGERDGRRQTCANRSNRRRKKKSDLRSLKRSRRSLDYQKESCEESSTQEEKIRSTSTSPTKKTTQDQKEMSKQDVSQERDTSMTEDTESVTKKPGEMEISKAEDEVVVIEVIDRRVPSTLTFCVFCDKIFCTKETLEAHRSKHLKNFMSKSDGGDPYQCDVCPMTFADEETLIEHLRGRGGDLHHGERKTPTPFDGFFPEVAISNNRREKASGGHEFPLIDVL